MVKGGSGGRITELEHPLGRLHPNTAITAVNINR